MLPEDSGFPSILALITLPCDCLFASVQSQSCLTLRDPMDCSTPGFPVHHQLPELTQTHVHRVGDAIQPTHPLPSIFPSIRSYPIIKFFASGGQSIGQSLFACYPTKPIHTLGHRLCLCPHPSLTNVLPLSSSLPSALETDLKGWLP